MRFLGSRKWHTIVRAFIAQFWNSWQLVIEKVVRWTIFNVLIALLPLGLNYLMFLSNGTKPTALLLFSRGEILLVSSAIAAGAIGELIGSGDKLKIIKFVVGGLSLILLAITSMWFAGIPSISNSATYDAQFIANNSIGMFIATVISSAWCVVLAEV